MNLPLDTFLLVIGGFTLTVISVLYVYFKFSFTHWKKKGVVYLQPTFPFGNLWDGILQRKNGGGMFKDLYEKLDGNKYGGIYSLNRPVILFRDPEIIKDVLVKNFMNFQDHGTYIDKEGDPLMAHLFTLTGNEWKNLRTKLSPIFSSGKLKTMFKIFVDCGNEFGKQFEICAAREEVIEMRDMAARYTTQVIASAAFGVECNCLRDPDAEFRQWGRKIFESNIKTGIRDIAMFLSPTLASVLKIPFVPNDVTRYFQKMIQDLVHYRETNDIKRLDFMHFLIELKNKHKNLNEMQSNGKLSAPMEDGTADVFTIDELAAQALVFFIGGFETTSTLLSFTFYELALHPDIQERARREIDEVLLKHDGNITYEAVQEMTYIDKLISETLRKYPPAPFIVRECTKPYTIPGTNVVIEKGTGAIISTLGLHYDPKYYPNPKKFDPDRFSEEVKSTRQGFTYLPFGEGPRICIGMRFGLLQAKVGIASVLSKNEVRVCEKTPVPLVIDPKSLITSALDGMWLKIVKRSEV